MATQNPSVDIIMPAYKGHDTITAAIASVLMQDALDEIRLTIVDDADERGYQEYVDRFSSMMNIRTIRKPSNTGCGQSRQYGMDHTDLPYFMFLDTDDVLASPVAVSKLLESALSSNCPIVISDFIEETENGNILHSCDFVWMHGKLLKTEWYKKHNIRFNFARANEDSAFNNIAYSLMPEVYNLAEVTYFWRNKKGSITRAENFVRDSMIEFIGNATYAHEEMCKRGVPRDRLNYVALTYFVSLYAYYYCFLQNNESQLFLKKFKRAVGEYYELIGGDAAFFEIPRDVIATTIKNHGLVNRLRDADVYFDLSLTDFLTMCRDAAHGVKQNNQEGNN